MWSLASSPSLCCALHLCEGSYKCGGMPQLTDFSLQITFKILYLVKTRACLQSKEKRQAVEAASVSPVRAEKIGMLLYCPSWPHHLELLTISSSSTEAAQSIFLGARFQVMGKAFWSALNSFI